MKTVAIYISDYGFGHATRSIAIIRELFKQSEEEMKVVICHSFAIGFLQQSLTGLNVEFREIHTDIGYYLKPNSIYPDSVKIREQYRNFTRDWPEKVAAEEAFLIECDVDIVLSDISPLPFTPSEKLGIPSIGISNFSWFTAYKDMVADEELQVFKEAYQQMDHFFSLAGSQEPRWGNETERFGFIVRETKPAEVEKIVNMVNPFRNKTVIYFGLGMKVDLETLDNLPIWKSKDCVFIVSSNMEVEKPNVYKIPKNYTESQNFVAASDVVISKAGWSTVSEAVLNEKPLIILDRNSMNEDKNTMGYLQSTDHVESVTWEQLMEMKIDSRLIEKVNKQKKSKLHNDAEKIAATILGMLS